LLSLGGIAFVAGALHWGHNNPPVVLPPTGVSAEAAIGRVFERPAAGDETVAGDYLIERFYTRDEEGNSFVVDMCKGRVKDVQSLVKADGTGSYTFVLDREGLASQQGALESYVRANSWLDSSVTYRGLKVQDGASEVFALNYTGYLPKKRSAFELPTFPDAFSFLSLQGFDDIARGAKLINIKGTYYLLSSTDVFPYFAARFGTKRSIFLSETFLISPP
jgi:hypothetical protein